MNVKILLSAAVTSLALSAGAQDVNRSYVITGDGNHDFTWMNIRQVNIGSGKVEAVVYDRTAGKAQLLDIATKRAVSIDAAYNGKVYSTPESPTATFVAAAALDKRSNKLFFTPMRKGELRWLDLDGKDNAKFYTVSAKLLNPLELADEANHVTRMAIGADGYGYAITNDGNHVFRFSTGNNPEIKDLGNLVDADGAGISIHNKCTSWGGDMIADAFGKLYVISANRHVFKIDVDSRITTHLGMIEGLPAGFTTNGAAVNADGRIVVASANSFSGYYHFGINDFKATLIEGSDNVYSVSDLANGNFLLQKEADKAAAEGRPVLADTRMLISNGLISVYPNPVSGSVFRVNFAGYLPGAYTIAMTDLLGRVLQTKVVNIQSGGQVETVSLKRKPAKGMYLVKVINNESKLVFSDKILID